LKRGGGLLIQLIILIAKCLDGVDGMDLFTKIVSDESKLSKLKELFLPDYPPDIAA